MEQIFGKGVSKGVAAGPISFYRRPSPGEIPRHAVTDTAAGARALPRGAGNRQGTARRTVRKGTRGGR